MVSWAGKERLSLTALSLPLELCVGLRDCLPGDSPWFTLIVPLQVSGRVQALLASSHSSFVLLRTCDWLSSALQGQSYSLAFFVLGLSAGCWHLWNCALGVMTSYSLGNLLFSGFHHLFSAQTLGM